MKALKAQSTPNPSEAGFVYVLISSQTDLIKIGGTRYPPLKRIKEINNQEPYKSLGSWQLYDFRQVLRWRAYERYLHYVFRDAQDRQVPAQKELFRLPAQVVSQHMLEIKGADLIHQPKVDRLFQDTALKEFLGFLLNYSALSINWLELQGAWTLSLYPKARTPRLYTINIGNHEVAFAALSKDTQTPIHQFHLDQSVTQLAGAKAWLSAHQGHIFKNQYHSQLQRSVSVSFVSDFAGATEFLQIAGVRRALLAYWTEALLILQQKNSLSLHSKHHHYNAVAELLAQGKIN